MPDPTTVLVIVSALTLGLPIAFLITVAYAAGRRRRGIPIGPRFSGFLTVFGGTAIGTFLLTAPDSVIVLVPILGSALLLAWLLWRRRRRVQSGQIVLGASLPWTILYALYGVGAIFNPGKFDVPSVATWLTVGLAGVIAGLVVIWRGDPPVPLPDLSAAPGDPGSRAVGNIAAAIRDAGRIGPFGTSELAALVAFVLVWFVVPLLLPAAWPRIVGFVASVLIGSVVATEAYIRAIPMRSRRAWEAYAWLGEHELEAAGDSASDPIPTTRAQAEDWLARHEDAPEDRWVRVEVLELAGRWDEARVAAAAMPDSTPSERWAKASAIEAADWRAGGPGDIEGLRAAAAELEPADGNERLRAEVAIAAAEVKRRMADGRSTPGDALEPLLEVRQRLGHRADGEVGRALRRRMLPLSLIVGLVFGAVIYIFGPSAGALF